MNGIITRLAASIMQPLRQSMWRSGRVVMLVLVALALLLIALGFATAAIASWLVSLYGPTPAALLMAASFLLLAAVALALAVRLHSAGRRPFAAALHNDGFSTSGDSPSSERSDIMGRSGEWASLVAGMAAANRLKPIELVSLAVLAGFLVGRRNG